MKLEKIMKNFIFILLGVAVSTVISAHFVKDKSVYGYIEPVTLLPDAIPVMAKLDTGAVTASISAKDIHIYKKNDKEYVKFEVSHPDIQQTPVYNLPVVGFSKIKNRASEGTMEEGGSESYDLRPIVKMSIYFDGKPHNVKVNLIDRSHFSTPMLLGRKILEKLNVVVDGAIENSI